jgi:hypothetical protein
LPHPSCSNFRSKPTKHSWHEPDYRHNRGSCYGTIRHCCNHSWIMTVDATTSYARDAYEKLFQFRVGNETVLETLYQLLHSNSTTQSCTCSITATFPIQTAQHRIVHVLSLPPSPFKQHNTELYMFYYCHLPHSNSTTQLYKASCGGGLEYLHRCPASRKRQQKGEPSARGYNWATLFLGDVNMGT